MKRKGRKILTLQIGPTLSTPNSPVWVELYGCKKFASVMATFCPAPLRQHLPGQNSEWRSNYLARQNSQPRSLQAPSPKA